MKKGFKNYFIVSVAWLLFIPGIVAACTCELPAAGKTEKQLIKLERKKSQAVFTGEVREIIIAKTASGQDSWTSEVRFKVLQSWKGMPAETVSVFTFNVCCICGYVFTVGERYLVYATGSEGGNLFTNTCTRTKTLFAANEDSDLRVLGKSNLSEKTGRKAP